MEWQQWGREDPFWGVASWPNKEKDGASPWKEEEFYALGESDFRDFIAHWEHYGRSRESCLEVGCGTGRMTRQLAKAFDHIYAVDVSQEMIDLARKNACANVKFFLVDGIQLPQRDHAVKAVFSTHVLQHLDDVAIGFSYFREFFRVLDNGGTLMIHLPIYSLPYETGPLGLFLRGIYKVFRRISGIRADLKRRKGRKMMRGTPYPMGRLYEFLLSLGFKNIEFRVFPTKANGKLHSFVFATK